MELSGEIGNGLFVRGIIREIGVVLRLVRFVIQFSANEVLFQATPLAVTPTVGADVGR